MHGIRDPTQTITWLRSSCIDHPVLLCCQPRHACTIAKKTHHWLWEDSQHEFTSTVVRVGIILHAQVCLYQGRPIGIKAIIHCSKRIHPLTDSQIVCLVRSCDTTKQSNPILQTYSISDIPVSGTSPSSISKDLKRHFSANLTPCAWQELLQQQAISSQYPQIPSRALPPTPDLCSRSLACPSVRRNSECKSVGQSPQATPQQRMWLLTPTCTLRQFGALHLLGIGSRPQISAAWSSRPWPCARFQRNRASTLSHLSSRLKQAYDSAVLIADGYVII